MFHATGSHPKFSQVCKAAKQLAMWTRQQDAQLVAFVTSRYTAPFASEGKVEEARIHADPLSINAATLRIETEHERLTCVAPCGGKHGPLC